MFLEGPRVGLEAPQKEHIELYLRWFNDPEVWSNILRNRPMGRAEEEEWLANVHKREGDVLFVIRLREGELPIGACGLHQLNGPNRAAELGIVIGEKAYWNRGYGGEVMNLLCRYGFQVLNLNRIGLSVYEYNSRGIRCYEKAGFRHEGAIREARFWEGRYWSVLKMGVLASEWRARQEPAALSVLCQVE